MKIARIDYSRCNEWQATNYVVVPDSMSEDDFNEAVDRAVEKYLEMLAILADEEPPYGWKVRPSTPRYAQFPDKTVSEIQAEFSAQQAEWDAWNEIRKLRAQSFASFLELWGIKTLYGNGTEDVYLRHIDWGHRHGTKLNYDDGSGGCTHGPDF